MRAWFRDPLTVFLLVGAVIYGAYALFATEPLPVIELTAETRSALIDEFEGLTGRRPDAEEIASLEREYIARELLFREALASGMHLTNPDVREALIESMRYRITGVIDDPSDDELANFYADNLERYRSEPTVSFEHVFFEDAPGSDVLARLSAGEAVTGDPFVHGQAFPGYGESMLRALFGQAFLDALKASPLDQWSGPLTSEYGTHFVFLRGTKDAERLSFRQVRQQVENDYRQAAIDEAVDAAVGEFEQRYDIRRPD